MLCDALGVGHRIGRNLPHWEYAVNEELEALLRKIYPEHPFGHSQGTFECGIFRTNLPDASVITLGCPYQRPFSERILSGK